MSKLRMNQAMNKCYYVFGRPCQMQAINEVIVEIRIVPRRAKYLFIGVQSQHPMGPEQS